MDGDVGGSLAREPGAVTFAPLAEMITTCYSVPRPSANGGSRSWIHSCSCAICGFEHPSGAGVEQHAFV